MTTDKQIIDRVEEGFAGFSAAFDTDGRLHARLAALAERRGLLDVSYRTIDSPLEPLLLAATGKGLVRVAFSREDHQSVLYPNPINLRCLMSGCDAIVEPPVSFLGQ